jgi:hypothetical protein
LKADQTARLRPSTSRTSSQRRKSRSRKSTRTPRLVIRAGEGDDRMHATFATGSNDSPAPGIIPEPVRVHDDPPRRPRRAASGRPHDSVFVADHPKPAENEPTKLEVEQWLPPRQPS